MPHRGIGDYNMSNWLGLPDEHYNAKDIGFTVGSIS
jgi:hypothetical protein